jgi:hypothetical protein
LIMFLFFNKESKRKNEKALTNKAIILQFLYNH